MANDNISSKPTPEQPFKANPTINATQVILNDFFYLGACMCEGIKRLEDIKALQILIDSCPSLKREMTYLNRLRSCWENRANEALFL